MYVPEIDRIVLAGKKAERSFVSPREVRKTAIMTRILQLVHEVLSKVSRFAQPFIIRVFHVFRQVDRVVRLVCFSGRKCI